MPIYSQKIMTPFNYSQHSVTKQPDLNEKSNLKSKLEGSIVIGNFKQYQFP